jgi:prepilin-type N-terminal cleavage/methylation domain-containing protein
MRKTLAQGFTLVELLIVIALLGVIATIVIAAINPIEQANRANDAGMKADASQMVSAIQRYYASHSSYPWMDVDPVTYASADTAFDYISAESQLVGLCGTACTGVEGTTGLLVSSDELQTTFLSKKFITDPDGDSRLFVGKGSGASSSVYICWIPRSKSSRQSVISKAQVVDVNAGFAANSGLPTYVTTCATPTDTAWEVTGNAMPTCAECVPE